MAISLRIQGALALVCIGAVACQTTPRLKGRETRTINGSLNRLNPTDVAVAPIRYGATGANAPENTLRRAAQVGLTRRRYSPLALSLVDESVDAAAASVTDVAAIQGSVLEASYAAGDVGEDAVLEITVHAWDDRFWNTRRRLDVVVEARMIDPADPFGPPLWAGKLDKTVDTTDVGGLDDSGQRAMESACAEIFEELFAEMPARAIDPAAGPDSAD
ncbi:MAG: hypothetical protein VX460_14105 [Planctomycetota bacterium]|nr:hypothetical protein [Planctomycetota bacterium]